jgi:NitT/TauT family transport system substrate-binding protein
MVGVASNSATWQESLGRTGVGPASTRDRTSPSRIPRWTKFGLLLGAMAIATRGAHAEVSELRVAKLYGIGYLQMMVMEHERLVEKHAKARGLDDIRTTWSTFADGTVQSDAVLSGNVDFVAGGLGSFITLWDRTRGSLAVKGVAALNSMPMFLNTRNPNVKSIRDFSESDRIAFAGVKVSSQALTFQLAAVQTFGDAEWGKLDHLSVNMAHPIAMQALLSGGSEITAHFAAPPFQYDELRQPGVRTVLNSYDVWGGPHTLIMVWTTSKFRDQNPKLYAAFVSALKEATDFINSNRQEAVQIYLQMTGDKTTSADALVRMLANPEIRYTLTPENALKFAAFKLRIGNIKTKPDSWKDLFFPEVHDLPGS